MNSTPPELSEHEQRRRLRWWFWVVLLAPAAVSPLIPGVVSFWAPSDPRSAGGWVMGASLGVLIPINAICSIVASFIFCRARTGRVGSVSVILNGFLFFAMNLILSYAGCMVIAVTASAFS